MKQLSHSTQQVDIIYHVAKDFCALNLKSKFQIGAQLDVLMPDDYNKTGWQLERLIWKRVLIWNKWDEFMILVGEHKDKEQGIDRNGRIG